MALALSRLERVFIKDQSDFSTIPTFAGGDAVRHIKVDASNDIKTLVRRDKTGSRSATLGVRGRGSGTWSYEGSLAPSGVVTTLPDFDPIFLSIFGQAAAVDDDTSLTYTFLDDPIKTFAMAVYKTPSSLNHKIAYGCVVNEAVFKIGEDIAEWTASGECKFVLEKDYFGSASTEEKGGLGSFPAEPASPVTTGGIIPGFTGSISIGGTVIARIRTAEIKINNGAAVVKDTFGSYLPDGTEGDERNVTLSFTMYEDDSAGQQAIRAATITKTPVDAALTVGTVAGSIVTFNLKNIQLASYQTDDSARRFSLTVPESRAFGTSTTSLDEVVIVIT